MRVTPSPDEVRDALETLAEKGVPARGKAWITDAGTGEYLEWFEREILDGLIAAGGATCRFYEGAYGGGKTHLLDLLHCVADRRGMAVVRTDLSQAIQLRDWKLVTQHILQNVTLHRDGSTVHGLPSILRLLGQLPSGDADNRDARRMAHPGFATAMRTMMELDLSEEARNRLMRYLCGERIGAGKLRAVGVHGVTDPLSERNAEQVLTTVANVLAECEVPGLMLLFDENEATLAGGARGATHRDRLAANIMRRLVDSCATASLERVVAVFAILPGFLGRCADAYSALGQRLEMPRLDGARTPWRWPVLEVERVSTINEPEAFAEGVLSRLMECASVLRIPGEGLRTELQGVAQEILASHAGSEYRRYMLKALSEIVLAGDEVGNP